MSNETVEEVFLIRVLDESKNGRNPFKDPPLNVILSTFRETSQREKISHQMEDKCYKALLLFTSDSSLNWAEKIRNIRRYFSHSHASSPTPLAISTFEAAKTASPNSFFRPAQTYKSSDYYGDPEGYFLSSLLNPDRPSTFRIEDMKQTWNSSPSKTVGRSTDNNGTPPKRNVRSSNQPHSPMSNRFSSEKLNQHSSPLFLSSPLSPVKTYFTEEDGIDTPPSTPHQTPTFSMQAAIKHWTKRHLRYGLGRFASNRLRRKGLHTSQSRLIIHTTGALAARSQLFRIRRAAVLSNSGVMKSNDQNDFHPYSTAPESPIPPSSPSPKRTRCSREPSDPIPTASTIRLLVLFENFLSKKPLGNFCHGGDGQRHPAPSILLHLSKLSPRYRLEEDQEKWLRARIIAFVEMETLDIFFRLWTEQIAVVIQAREYHRTKLMRRGLESLQDFALTREVSHRRTGVRGSTVNYNHYRSLKFFHKWRAFVSKRNEQRVRVGIADGQHGDVLSRVVLRLWRDRTLTLYRAKKRTVQSQKRREEVEIRLRKIHFKRIYDRLKLFPIAHKLVLRRVVKTKLHILLYWLSVYYKRKRLKNKTTSRSQDYNRTQYRVDVSNSEIVQLRAVMKWKVATERFKQTNLTNLSLAESHYMRYKMSIAISSWIFFRSRRVGYVKQRKSGRRNQSITRKSQIPVNIKAPLNINLYILLLRWKSITQQQRQRREYICSMSRAARMYHGYPVNNGRTISGCLTSKGHTSLGAKIFQALLRNSMGKERYGVRHIPVELGAAFAKFRCRCTQLGDHRAKYQSCEQRHLRKAFKLMRARLVRTRGKRLVQMNILKSMMWRWRYSKVKHSVKRRFLRRVFLHMRQQRSMNRRLVFWHNNSAFPRMRDAFLTLKLKTHECISKGRILEAMRQSRLLQLSLSTMRLILTATRCHRQLAIRRFFRVAFTLPHKRIAIVKRCARFRQMKRWMKYTLRVARRREFAERHHTRVVFLCSLTLFGQFLSRCERFKKNLNQGVLLYRLLARKRFFRYWRLYMEKRAAEAFSLYRSRLSLGLWKFLNKMNFVISQRRLLRISHRFYLVQACKRYFIKWSSDMVYYRRIRARKNLGRKFEEHRKKSLAFYMLAKIAQVMN